MASYSYGELLEIANAVRNVWSDNYNGGYLPGMSNRIGSTGDLSFEALQGNVIEIVGNEIFSSGMPLTAIIAMKDFGQEAARRIQNGYGPFDMKPGFLKSPKARINKKGKKYFIMSFRHTTPGATKTLGKNMSPSVHRAAKGGESFEDQTGTREDPSDFGLVNSRDYEWQNGAQAGMTNIRDEQGKHSQFRTFRIISENSDPSSWWHPGVDSNDVIGATIDYVQPYVAEGLKRAAKAEVINKINEIFSHPLSV